MIRSLRQRHFLIFICLWVVLPLLYFAGLKARKVPAEMTNLPEIFDDKDLVP